MDRFVYGLLGWIVLNAALAVLLFVGAYRLRHVTEAAADDAASAPPLPPAPPVVTVEPAGPEVADLPPGLRRDSPVWSAVDRDGVAVHGLAAGGFYTLDGYRVVAIPADTGADPRSFGYVIPAGLAAERGMTWCRRCFTAAGADPDLPQRRRAR